MRFARTLCWQASCPARSQDAAVLACVRAAGCRGPTASLNLELPATVGMVWLDGETVLD